MKLNPEIESQREWLKDHIPQIQEWIEVLKVRKSPYHYVNTLTRQFLAFFIWDMRKRNFNHFIQIINLINPTYKWIFEEILKGTKYKDIAKRINKSTQYVKDVEWRVMKTIVNEIPLLGFPFIDVYSSIKSLPLKGVGQPGSGRYQKISYLINKNINTIGDLISYSRKELIQIDFIGPILVDEIIKLLKGIGLSLSSDLYYIKEKEPYLLDIDLKAKEAFMYLKSCKFTPYYYKKEYEK